MNKNLLKLFFSSGVQAIAVQVLGVAFFVIISLVMPKEDFGIINWANAVAVTLTIILGFGLDNVVLRRISASKSSDWTAAAFFMHSIIGSGVVFLLLWFSTGVFTGVSNKGFYYLPWFFAAQGIIAIANPLKQYLNAKQNFAPYAIIAVVVNVIKLLMAFWVIKHDILTVEAVYIILIICACSELLSLLIYVAYKKLSFKFRLLAYTKLIKEAFPQYIATLFDSSLSRTDWILLGLLTTNVITAEYSFAYRAYEMARLPQSILNPVLLGIFAKLFVNNRKLEDTKARDINDLFTVEIFFAMLLPLTLNIIWSPLLDYFFDGKYGTVNHDLFLILSLCIPFQFFINILWSLSFSSKHYKPISMIIGATSIFNIIFNFVLIPYMGAAGAAIVYLATTILQLIGYFIWVRKNIMKFSYVSFARLLVIVSVVYIFCEYYIHNVILRLLSAVVLYAAISFLTRTIKKSDMAKTFALLRK